MADLTGIAWCDSTINLWIGCTKVSPACDNCYAELLGRRFGVEWGGERKRTGAASWGKIEAYQRGAKRYIAKHGRPRRVFINSMSDFFDNQVDQSWRDQGCIEMERAPDVIFILVTKRPQNVWKMVPKHWLKDWPKHIWLLTTAENQEQYDLRVGHLLSIPGRPLAGISMEPMLEPIHPHRSISFSAHERAEWCAFNIKKPVDRDHVNVLSWIIIGGESGRNARPMPTDEQVAAAVRLFRSGGRAVFVKQRSQATHPHTFKQFDAFPNFLKIRSHP